MRRRHAAAGARTVRLGAPCLESLRFRRRCFQLLRWFLRVAGGEAPSTSYRTAASPSARAGAESPEAGASPDRGRSRRAAARRSDAVRQRAVNRLRRGGDCIDSDESPEAPPTRAVVRRRVLAPRRSASPDPGLAPCVWEWGQKELRTQVTRPRAHGVPFTADDAGCAPLFPFSHAPQHLMQPLVTRRLCLPDAAARAGRRHCVAARSGARGRGSTTATRTRTTSLQRWR